MACTPEQCAELNLQLEAFTLELQAIDLELAALQAERETVQNAIETTLGCIDFCECGGAPMGASEEKKTSLTPQERARTRVVARLIAMARQHPPTASNPKQV